MTLGLRSPVARGIWLRTPKQVMLLSYGVAERSQVAPGSSFFQYLQLLENLRSVVGRFAHECAKIRSSD